MIGIIKKITPQPLTAMNDETYRLFLQKLAPLDDKEWSAFSEILRIRNFKKNESFHLTGRKCRTVGFILKGCFRSVKEQNEKERTFDFAVEEEFITDYYSILTGKPSEVTIIAVEDSTVICADAAKMLRLFDSSFSWQKIGRHLAEYVARYYQERLIASFYETPRIRYRKLMESSPELFLRVPLHILADYLGMTKETLSRLRKKER